MTCYLPLPVVLPPSNPNTTIISGIVSYGMVMCASSPDSCEILTPPADSKPGDMVTVEGFPGTPDPQLNPKKKVSSYYKSQYGNFSMFLSRFYF